MNLTLGTNLVRKHVFASYPFIQANASAEWVLQKTPWTT